METAYLINRRRFRENSFLVDLITQNKGRVTGIVRVAKKRGRITQGVVQPFIQLKVGWVGKGELVTITQMDEVSRYHLAPSNLSLGLYFNELLLKLLPAGVPFDTLAEKYHDCMVALLNANAQSVQEILVLQQIRFLDVMGYQVTSLGDVETGEIISDMSRCVYSPDAGVRIDQNGQKSGIPIRGDVMLMLAKEQIPAEYLSEARLYIDRIVDSLLEGKTLNARQLIPNR